MMVKKEGGKAGCFL